MPRETEVKSDLLHEVRMSHKDWWCLSLAGSQFQMPGLPDCLFLKEGYHIFVECKGAETKVQKHQTNVHRILREKGSIVYILRFVDKKEWILSDGTQEYSIKFSKFTEGVTLFLDTMWSVTKCKPDLMDLGYLK